MPRRSATEIRDDVLVAAASCFRAQGVGATGVDDIVRASGVARATMYRHAGGRDDVLLAVLLREIDDLLAALLARLDDEPTVVDLLVDGVQFAVEFVRGSAVLHDLLTGAAVLAPDVAVQAMAALVDRLRTFVDPLFADRELGLRPELEPAVAIEHLVRTITSLVAIGDHEPSRSERAHYLRRTLVPVFVPDDVAERLTRR